jgi:hypothetical protein
MDGPAEVPTSERLQKLIVLVNELKRDNAELAHALTVLYLEQADYIRINNLGDAHHNHSMALARDTLLKCVS